MPAHVIFHKGRYEIIAVVVAGLAPERERDGRLLAGAFQKVGAKLLGQKLIGIAVIDEEVGKPRAVLDEGDGIVLAPGGVIAAEISAHIAGDWRADVLRGKARALAG